MSKRAKEKRQTPRRTPPKCMICGKELRRQEWPQDPREQALCDEHARQFSRR